MMFFNRAESCLISHYCRKYTLCGLLEITSQVTIVVLTIFLPAATLTSIPLRSFCMCAKTERLS